MGGASYPKPDGERRNRAERQLDWTMLPFEGRAGDPPALPKWREWTEQTLEWWAELWATPQATRWDPTGRSMHTMALLHHELMTDAGNSSKLSAEMRQHEDRHGLTPKAMLQLRWRVAAPLPAADAAPAPVLSIVPDVPARPDPDALPSKRAKKAEWVAWAVAWGAEQSAAEKLSKASLIREFSSVSPVAASPAMPGKRPPSKAAQRLRERAHR